MVFLPHEQKHVCVCTRHMHTHTNKHTHTYIHILMYLQRRWWSDFKLQISSPSMTEKSELQHKENIE